MDTCMVLLQGSSTLKLSQGQECIRVSFEYDTLGFLDGALVRVRGR
jgi:hypothetical protein